MDAGLPAALVGAPRLQSVNPVCPKQERGAKLPQKPNGLRQRDRRKTWAENPGYYRPWRLVRQHPFSDRRARAKARQERQIAAVCQCLSYPQAHLTNRMIPTNAQPMASRPEAIVSKSKRMPPPAANPTKANLPTTAKTKAQPGPPRQVRWLDKHSSRLHAQHRPAAATPHMGGTEIDDGLLNSEHPR